MSIDPITGEIIIEDGGLAICPDTSRDKFLASPYGASARLVVENLQFATYCLTFNLGASQFAMSVVFKSQRLDSLRLQKINPGATWASWSEAKELECKDENDRLLALLLGKPPYKFAWGEIVSVYDSRNGSAGITIQYRNSNTKSS